MYLYTVMFVFFVGCIFQDRLLRTASRWATRKPGASCSHIKWLHTQRTSNLYRTLLEPEDCRGKYSLDEPNLFSPFFSNIHRTCRQKDS